ncbi:MAG TPA: hypothetical protein VHV08_16410 [Pirellulales bacterium]|nr:hypothetical protein [Pirellulales bacterium]
MRYIPRKKLLIDSKVQGALLTRAVVYWCLFALTVSQLLLCWQIAHGPDAPFFSHFRLVEIFRTHADVAIAGVLLLPIILLDTIFISNRIVGPLVRLRTSLKQLADGQPVANLGFRQHDFWREIANELNRVSQRMTELEQELQAARGQNSRADDKLAGIS